MHDKPHRPPDGSPESRIRLVRGRRVILSHDIAELYGVPSKRLNQQVRRNAARFPADFMFRLTAREAADLRSQNATSSPAWGGARYVPLAFTEQGVAMLSGVLTSKRAIRVNIAIMRAFVKVRELLAAHRDLALRIDELEKKYDGRFATVFQALRQLMTVETGFAENRTRIGFGRRRPGPSAGTGTLMARRRA